MWPTRFLDAYTKNAKLRFLSSISFDKKTGCWNWTRKPDNQGYGIISFKSKSLKAHRLSYMLFKGELIDCLEIDHLCRNKKCVNPNHLEQVTHLENGRRGNTGLWQRIKTHCPDGHEYTENNIKLRKGSKRRDCKICLDLASRYRNVPRYAKDLLNTESITA